MFETSLLAYSDALSAVTRGMQATGAAGRVLTLDEAAWWTAKEARRAHAEGGKVIFVGNGGSATIASHMAIDYAKNGGIRAVAFNDPAFLTCLGNDLGYENVFAQSIAMLGTAGDLLVAISSSGRSANILNAVAAARAKGMPVLTLSGFGADNPLRRLGDRNVYAGSATYGMVEIAHLVYLHGVLDLTMGWNERREPALSALA